MPRSFIVRLRKGGVTGNIVANSQVIELPDFAAGSMVGTEFTDGKLSGRVSTFLRRATVNKTLVPPLVPFTTTTTVPVTTTTTVAATTTTTVAATTTTTTVAGTTTSTTSRPSFQGLVYNFRMYKGTNLNQPITNFTVNETDLGLITVKVNILNQSSQSIVYWRAYGVGKFPSPADVPDFTQGAGTFNAPLNTDREITFYVAMAADSLSNEGLEYFTIDFHFTPTYGDAPFYSSPAITIDDTSPYYTLTLLSGTEINDNDVTKKLRLRFSTSDAATKNPNTLTFRTNVGSLINTQITSGTNATLFNTTGGSVPYVVDFDLIAVQNSITSNVAARYYVTDTVGKDLAYYDLMVVNGGGGVSGPATLTVKWTPTVVSFNQAMTLQWNSTGVTYVNITLSNGQLFNNLLPNSSLAFVATNIWAGSATATVRGYDGSGALLQTETATINIRSVTVTASTNQVQEGSTVTLTLSASNIAANSTLFYRIKPNLTTPTLTVQDFDIIDGQIQPGSMIGQKSLNGFTTTIALKMSNDLTTEGDESFSVLVYYIDSNVNFADYNAVNLKAEYQVNTTEPTITVKDSSLSRTSPLPSNVIYSPSNLILNETDNRVLIITFDMAWSASIPVYWRVLAGTTTLADFDGVYSGVFNTRAGTTISESILVRVSNDLVTLENTETFSVEMYLNVNDAPGTGFWRSDTISIENTSRTLTKVDRVFFDNSGAYASFLLTVYLSDNQATAVEIFGNYGTVYNPTNHIKFNGVTFNDTRTSVSVTYGAAPYITSSISQYFAIKIFVTSPTGTTEHVDTLFLPAPPVESGGPD